MTEAKPQYPNSGTDKSSSVNVLWWDGYKSVICVESACKDGAPHEAVHSEADYHGAIPLNCGSCEQVCVAIQRPIISRTRLALP